MTTSEPRWLTAEEQAVWRQWLYTHSRLMSALARGITTDSGLSAPDFEVLVHISEAPEQRLRILALAEVLRWERSRLSHQVKRMEQRGLLCRSECPSDKRGAFIVLTPAGQAALEDAVPGHVEAVRSMFIDVLSPAELESLGKITGKVLDQLP